LIDSVCQSSVQKDLQFLFLNPFSTGPLTSSVTGSSAVPVVANPASVNFPFPNNINCYSTHQLNHKKYWNRSFEGNSNYILSLQEYLYKNKLFQRLLLYYRYVGCIQIDLYGLKEILSLKPLPAGTTTTTTASKSAADNLPKSSQMNKGMTSNPSPTAGGGGFLSFFSNLRPETNKESNSSHSKHSTATTGGVGGGRGTGTPTSHLLSHLPHMPQSHSIVLGNSAHANSHLASSSSSASSGLLGLGTHSHSTNIAALVPTAAPHTQSMEIYAVLRLVKEFFPKADRSSHHDESYVTPSKRVEILSHGLFPFTTNPNNNSSSHNSSNRQYLSQIQTFNDFEFRQQVFFRFPLPEEFLSVIEEHFESYLSSYYQKNNSNNNNTGGRTTEKKEEKNSAFSSSFSSFSLEEESLFFDNFMKTLPPMKVVITVYEKTFFSDLKLGEMEMNLFELNDQNISRDWFPLITGEKQISYLLYSQTKLRFHLMQMDSNEFLYQYSNINNPSQPANTIGPNNNSNNSSGGPSQQQSQQQNSTGRVVGRGQAHPFHLFPQKESVNSPQSNSKTTTSSGNNSNPGGKATNFLMNVGKAIPVIKISSHSSDNFMNLYKDQEEDEETHDEKGRETTRSQVRPDTTNGSPMQQSFSSSSPTTNILKVRNFLLFPFPFYFFLFFFQKNRINRFPQLLPLPQAASQLSLRKPSS
jgi:hypothetical protein